MSKLTFFLRPLSIGFPLVLLITLAILITSSPPESAAAESIGLEGSYGPDDGAARPPQQQPAGDGIWQDVDEIGLQSQGQRDIVPSKFRLVAADINALDSLLAQAPMEGDLSIQSAPTVLALPMPDGTFQRFQIQEYAMMEAGLAAKFPEITNYLGQGLDDSTATIRLDRTPAGFHGMIISTAGTVYIDPYSRGDIVHYMSYYKQDYGNVWEKSFQEEAPIAAIEEGLGSQDISDAAHTSSGPTLRTYRLAVAATVEYTTFHGGTVPLALAAINTTMNRVNGIYEREVSVRMTLVANNNLIVFTSEPDGYTNGDPDAMIVQNKPIIDANIGNGNYDIGHVFGTNSGGLAGPGPCLSSKASGVTGSSAPVGDPFDIDYVAHEMGHQYNANHTFNAGATGSCIGGNRNGSTAYEPGSASTILGYAGICGSQNLQNNSDDYFHGISFDEIMSYVTTFGTCSNNTATGNNTPTVEAGASYTIPKQTPFVLTGSASDADGNSLTYGWEEFDLGNPPSTEATLPNTDADGNARPIFRSYQPVTYTHRNFPVMTNILDNSYQNNGESLPSIGRTMEFRLTARDNLGGVAHDTMNVTVSDASGPFRVTTPAGTEVWAPGSQQTVTWNVAGTIGAPVSCATVDILMSTDGGQTFPTTILAGTPNDGSENVTLPGNAAINAVIKVQCSNSIFFDASGVAVCTPLFQDDHEGTNNWTTNNGAGSNSWTRVSNAANANSSTNYWFVDNNSGTDTDSRLESPAVNATSTNLFLQIFHKYNLEQQNATDAFDGGLLEISVNGGAFTYIDETKFTKNGYTHTAEGSTPFIANQKVFSGNSGGYVETNVDLSTLVAQGQNFNIRFREVNDQTIGVDGWYVDDVLICDLTQPATVNLTLTKSAPSTVTPGDSITYTLVAKNLGSLTATNVLITDVVPANTILDSASDGATSSGTAAGSTITWTTNLSLTQNESLTRSFVVSPTGSGTIVNTGYVSATTAISVKASNTVNTTVISGFNYLPIILKN